jgi:hypothetical protein
VNVELPYTLSKAERALLAPALERAAHHAAQQRAAMDEVGRLLSMRTGLPAERIVFDPDTFTITERPPPAGSGG